MKLSQNPASDEPLQRRLRLLITFLVLATFAVHLASGIYYVIGPMSPFHSLRLDTSGDAFLGLFPTWNDRQEFDDAAYNRPAVEILRNGIPRDHTGALFAYAPVYAYFVAGCYLIGGFRILAIAIPQAALAALTCGLLALATYHIAPRAKSVASLTAGMLFLVNLRLAMYVGYISPTILLIFFFSLAVWATSRPFTTARLCVFVASLILAVGTQAGFFFIALAADVWLVIRFFRTRQRALLVATIVLLFFAGGKTVLPTLFHQDSPGSVNETGQAVLWEANNPYYETMGPFSLWERRPGNPWTHWKMSPEEQQRHEMYLERTNHRTIQAALLWIKENPGQYAKLIFVRLWTTLGPCTGMMSPRNRMISAFIWILIFPAGVYGWWRCRHLPVSGFSAAVALFIILSSAFVIVEWYLRYRLPLDLLLTMYAGIGYSDLLRGSQKASFGLASAKNLPAG